MRKPKEKQDQSRRILSGRPGRTLFYFAMPMILGNLFQQFYNMADSVIVGKYVGEEALAAVGASYSLTTVFIMIAIGGGIGASVLTSQYLGAGEAAKMKTSVYTALFSFLGLSILLAAGGLWLHRGILIALKTPDNILDQAAQYLRIYFCGLPFLFLYNVLSAMFHALGKSKIPLFLLLFSSLLNVGLDLYTVCILGWGVAGVAAATVAAQGLSAALSFGILMGTLKRYACTDGKPRLYQWSMLARGTRIAVPSIVQQSIVSIGMLLVQSVVNGFGSSVLAGYSAGSRVESLCIVPMIATGNAVSTFTAQNLGAEQADRVKKGYRAGMCMVAVFAGILFVLLQLFHESAVQAFLNEDAGREALQTGSSYLFFISFFFVLIGGKAVTDGVLRGAGDVGVYMASNLANLTIRVAFANLAAPYIGVQAVWWAVPIGWAVNLTLSGLRYRTGRWSCKKVI